MQIKTALIWCALVSCVLAFCSWFVHPFGRVKQTHSASPLLSGASIDAGTQTIIRRSCANCHSDSTEWPWYSYVAPVSWLIENDVQRGRSRMNLSQWQAYTTEQKVALLDEIETLTKDRVMPFRRYLLLHRDARLSDADINEVSVWIRAERDRLRSLLRSRPGVEARQR